MARVTLNAVQRLYGTIAVPGDKSISHRAVMLNALAQGQATITNFLDGADCRSTVTCLQALGVPIVQHGETVQVQGVGLRGLQEPALLLDCGNSGTTLRLFAGILAGQPLFAVLSGDASLQARPQRRIVEPLRQLGAWLDGRSDGNYAPLAVRGHALHGGSYTLPVASAQVKSALLLAALSGDAPLTLTGRIDSRDHTERMLQAMGAQLTTHPEHIVLYPPAMTADASLQSLSLRVPGDPSSAAFWWVAAAIHPNAQITTEGVCLNPTRTGALDVLQAMGAAISISHTRTEGCEPVGDVTVRSSHLQATDIRGSLIPRLIDELPILALAAACAQGTTTIADAQELRIKETDRIAAVAEALSAFGSTVSSHPDGMTITGHPAGLPHGATVSSLGDHRLAMAWAIAALVAPGATTIQQADAVAVSYPAFWAQLKQLDVDVTIGD
ncbi:MAG: 3-phosphoshikimate 1-carboxyvinyltransferase [Chloroflexaceae bacterium]|nr:3-phosphoshikimate 1-carboxyvinyltransferase [Chloroflexaceae bacterium]